MIGKAFDYGNAFENTHFLHIHINTFFVQIATEGAREGSLLHRHIWSLLRAA